MGASGVVQVFLATVFFVSALSKFRDYHATKMAMVAAGLGQSLSQMGARVLPFLEVATAVLLLWEPSPTVAGVMLFLMLACFLIATIRLMGQGIPCNCFGNLTSEVFSWGTAVRIAVLGLLNSYLLTHREPTQWVLASPGELISALVISVDIILIYAVLPEALRLYRR